MNRLITCFCVVSLIFFFGFFFPAQVFSLAARVSPKRALIDWNYRGTEITVSGRAKANEEIIAKVSLTKENLILRKKKKVEGIWLNGENLVFSRAPLVYLIYYSNFDLDSLKEKDKRERLVGYSALSKAIEIRVLSELDSAKLNGEEKRLLFREFVALQTEKGLYAIRDSAFSTSTSDGIKRFSAKIFLPSQAPPGTYKIEVFGIIDAKIKENVELKFKLEKTGIVDFIEKTALQSPFEYAAISILVVISYGFIASLIFKRSSK